MSNTTTSGNNPGNLVTGLVLVLAASIAIWTLMQIIWEHEREDKQLLCKQITENSQYVTKFIGNTCWLQLSDGSDGTDEAWIPSEWKMG